MDTLRIVVLSKEPVCFVSGVAPGFASVFRFVQPFTCRIRATADSSCIKDYKRTPSIPPDSFSLG